MYSLLAKDNQLWRQLYWQTFGTHPTFEREWITVYQSYYWQEEQMAATTVIQWRLASKHRLLTEANWYHKRYVEYRHKVDTDDVSFSHNTWVATGPSGVLICRMNLKTLSFISPTQNDHLMTLYVNKEQDEVLPVANIGHVRIMIDTKYLVVLCSDRDTKVTHLLVWRVGQQVPQTITYVSPHFELRQLVDRWLLASMDVKSIGGISGDTLDQYRHGENGGEPIMSIESMSDKANNSSNEIMVINVETGELIYRFRHVSPLAVHLQHKGEKLRLFRIYKLSSLIINESDTTEPSYWQWEVWQYNGKREHECRAKGTIELSHQYNQQVCSRELTENRVLLSRAPFPIGSDDTYSVLEIEEKQQKLMTSASASAGPGQRLWTASARNYDLPLPPINRLLTYARGEDCCLVDIDTGEIKEIYAIGSIECIDHAIASLCVAHVDNTLALIDVKTGEKTILVENMYDQRGYWEAVKSCIYYWHQESGELRILDFNSNLPLNHKMDKERNMD
jgi:hypothetical protein